MVQEQQGLQISGRAYLLAAIAIFGAANAVTRKITEIGAANLIDGRNPISFCNVLFKTFDSYFAGCQVDPQVPVVAQPAPGV